MAYVKTIYYPYEKIAAIAANFLSKYHPADNYPTPIEEIIEFQLRMDIIPIPGLHKAFDVDGFLSSDLSSISVDLDLSESRPGRYRFTLAHEVGHSVLHHELYKQNKFSNIDNWRKFVASFPKDQYSWVEWHANVFAGLVLVPPAQLAKRYKYHAKQVKRLNIYNPEVALEAVSRFLAEDFVVSAEVIKRRLEKDRLV